MTQITENQHFVPQFYLKRFSKKGQIQVFDVRAKRIGRPSSCKKECYEKFFYAAENGVRDEISQAFEDVFCRIEDVSAKALRGVIERAVAQHLTNGDLDELAYFMGSGLASELRAQVDFLPVTACEVRPEARKPVTHVYGP